MRKYLTIALIIGWASTIAYFFIQKNSLEKRLYQEKRVMMGTFVEVISPQKKAPKIVFDEINRIEGLLSKYNPESEVSKLNKFGTIKASPETFYVIKKSKEFYSLSNGAFDITVAPLMDLWGFTDRKYFMPPEEKIREVLKLVGSDKIILQDSSFVIQFKTPGMKIDLGAIAKGYAVDCAIKKIRDSGIKNCLINAGGQIYCLGNRFGKPWIVAIKNPRANGLVNYLKLENRAISTSGDYEQFFIKDKKRYAHIINPRTGFPSENSILSITVIATDGLTADALSTSIFVLGKEKGEELAKKLGKIELKIIEK
ncbi:MAG: FAD:protein FMN transferase [Candidatus Omnitrophota bacterium]|jgi:thiamine biosynthesis lipoprotein